MRRSFWSGTLVRLSVLLFLRCLSVSAQANQSGGRPSWRCGRTAFQAFRFPLTASGSLLSSARP